MDHKGIGIRDNLLQEADIGVSNGTAVGDAAHNRACQFGGKENMIQFEMKKSSGYKALRCQQDE